MATAPETDSTTSPDERAKPPFLRRVRIRGYKSIAFCDVTLEPLTILVGRNATGKSNFLDALDFLTDLVDRRISVAVDERKGWSSIHCRDNSSSDIEIGIQATFESYKSVWDAEYSFSLELANHQLVRVNRESLLLSERGRERRCGYRFAGNRLEWIGQEHFEDDSEWTTGSDIPRLISEDKLEDPRIFARLRFDKLLLGVIATQPFSDLAEGFRASCIYNFSPLAIRQLQLKTTSPVLAPDGSNLARAIEGLREIDPDTVNRVGQYLSAIVDGLQRFQPVVYGDYETLQFTLVARPNAPPACFDASSMSDGTLRILATLVAAYQIYLPTLASGFAGLEEPETSLHPAAMRALVDALDEATLRKQILLTTHSSEMLDNPTIKPENVRVVEMIDGQTVIGPVDAANVEIVREKLSTLGGLERDNLLQADLDDLDRQRHLSQNGQERTG